MHGFPVERLSKLTLGTAQLGLQYGIANRRGYPSDHDALTILDEACAAGITCLDTARAYGLAEERIGTWCRVTGHQPLIISKLPALAPCADSELGETVRRHFEASCRVLGMTMVAGYLTHRADDLQQPGVAEALRSLRAEGKLSAFGVSAYTPAEVDRALCVSGMGMVQVPINAFDDSMVTSGVLTRCLAAGVAVFARSVFLQGLFFLDPDSLPPHLQPARPALKRLRALADQAERSVAALALAAVRDLPGVSSIVIGVDSVEHLKANTRAARLPTLDAGLLKEIKQLGKDLPREVLDPSQWPRTVKVTA